jgi:glycosyltransferase involved in cell wall biosynthesis
MEVLGRELAERLPVHRFDVSGLLGDAEAFNLPPWRAVARAGREIRLIRALRELTGLIHFPNHHHARYGPVLGRPYVVTVHDLVRHTDHRRPEPLIHRPSRIDRVMLERDLAGIRQASAIIAVSRTTRREMIEQLGLDPDRVHVIHPGIDPRRFHPVCGPPLSHRYILFVGSEQPRKNFDGLLEAFRLLKASGTHRQLRLIKAGDAGGAEAPFRRHTLERIADLGLQDEVELVGRVGHRRLLELLSGAACLVQPSWHEGFGLPPLEAMACGCPVVVSDRGALPEVAGPAALVTEPVPEALAAEIDLVLSDAGLREGLRLAGLAHAQRFSWRTAACRTLELYRRLGAGSGAGLKPAVLSTRRLGSPPAGCYRT